MRKLYPTLRSYGYALAILSAATTLHLTLRATVGITTSGATFLYILALLMAAWRGFGPGYLTLLLGLAVVPYLYRNNFSPRNIDPSAVVMLVAVSTATSQLSRVRHRIEAGLRAANKQANAALLRRVAELETLYSQLPVGLCFLDTGLRYVRVNDKLAAMHGRPAESHIGRPHGEVVNPRMSEILDPLLRRVLETGSPTLDYEVTGPLSLSGEEDRDYMITCSRVGTPEGAVVGLQVVIQDITERKQAERGLARANEQLKQFSYLAAHDLQEPLRTIVNFSELARRKAGAALPSDVDGHLHRVAHAARRMSGLISDVLAYTRSSSSPEAPPSPVDLDAVLSSTLESLGQLIEENEATVLRGPLPLVAGDGSRLAQVLQNLISNAIKYRKPNVAPVLRISAREQGDRWTIAVEDNGQGFRQEYADQIFGIFKRLHGQSVPGSGIGLAICKAIIEQHGGTIWAESVPGSGTTFFFTLRGVTLDRSAVRHDTAA